MHTVPRIAPRTAPTYVERQVLTGIADVFDPEALWQAPGLALFARRPLLRDLLERAPRERRGNAATRCFSHVTLVLPQEEVDDDRHLTRGARVRDLTQGLAALHQRDFGDLLGGDEVRYRVLGADGLAPGEVEVRFGHAVYLPAPGEAVQHTVGVSRDSAVWKTACAIYPNQRLTLIGQDEHGATCAAPGWPFGAEGAVLLVNDGPGLPLEVQVRPRDAFDCVYDAVQDYYVIRSRRGAVDGAGVPLRLLLRVTPAAGPAAAPSVQDARQAPAAVALPSVAARARLQQAGAPAAAPAHRAVPAAPPAAGATHAAGGTPAHATLQGQVAIAAQTAHMATLPGRPLPAQPAAGAPMDDASADAMPAAPAPASLRPAAVWKPRLAPDDQRTALPAAPGAQRQDARSPQAIDAEATYAPLARHRVALAALALPRLSRYRDTGAQALEIGLDRALAPAAAGNAVITFAVDQADGLHAITAAGREAIGVPSSFRPVDNGAVDLLAVAPGMADRYCALLRLPPTPALPAAPGARCVFGRAAPALAALRVLDSPRFLRHAAGSAASSADRLGLSRSAFSFDTAEDGFDIARLSPTQALYHLDERLAFVAAIDAATPEAPYRLPAGHHLVAGHYVLRFEA
ncbi:hypothetical protein HH212_23840 [Massilia forsythiae]|uniref:Uncharacterized protein n=1 Tax=Massilia forsythiae TaxID=2728020 RepID=A0A7Z2W0L0_9BURK|nr:hypothetical protein [Massilia forsythiae]QJE02674.1 hypothetical protein HH212_23840 [Massilia forsythiae]